MARAKTNVENDRTTSGRMTHFVHFVAHQAMVRCVRICSLPIGLLPWMFCRGSVRQCRPGKPEPGHPSQSRCLFRRSTLLCSIFFRCVCVPVIPAPGFSLFLPPLSKRYVLWSLYAFSVRSTMHAGCSCGTRIHSDDTTVIGVTHLPILAPDTIRLSLVSRLSQVPHSHDMTQDNGTRKSEAPQRHHLACKR